MNIKIRITKQHHHGSEQYFFWSIWNVTGPAAGSCFADVYRKEDLEFLLLTMISLGKWFIFNDVSDVKFIDGEFVYTEESES